MVEKAFAISSCRSPGRISNGSWQSSLSETYAFTRTNTSLACFEYLRGSLSEALSNKVLGIPKPEHVGEQWPYNYDISTPHSSKVQTAWKLEVYGWSQFQVKVLSRRMKVNEWGTISVSLTLRRLYAPYRVEIFGNPVFQSLILLMYSTLNSKPFAVNKGATLVIKSLMAPNWDEHQSLQLPWNLTTTLPGLRSLLHHILRVLPQVSKWGDWEFVGWAEEGATHHLLLWYIDTAFQNRHLSCTSQPLWIIYQVKSEFDD